MKVLAILQNAWGDRELPMIFRPNPFNKSCKVLCKIIGEDNRLFFSNTTPVVTKTASGIAKPDFIHIELLLKQVENYDFVLICGAQAKKALSKYKLSRPSLAICHPASRGLTNVKIYKTREVFNKLTAIKQKYHDKVGTS